MLINKLCYINEIAEIYLGNITVLKQQIAAKIIILQNITGGLQQWVNTILLSDDIKQKSIQQVV